MQTAVLDKSAAVSFFISPEGETLVLHFCACLLRRVHFLLRERKWTKRTRKRKTLSTVFSS